MKNFILLIFFLSLLLTGCIKTDANNFEKGNKAFEQKDYISAIKFYQKEIKKNPQNAKAYSQYCGAGCYAYDKNKNIDINKTLFICDKAVELNSNIAETHFYKGRIYDSLKKHKEAVEEYTKAIQVNSKYEKAYLNRGNAKKILGMIKDAILDYSKAIELSNPEDSLLAYTVRGYAYLQLGEKQKAYADFKYVSNSNINNNNARNYALRGDAKVQMQDLAGGVFDLKKAIALAASKIEYYYTLARAQGLMEDINGVIETCTKGIKKFKNQSELLYMMRGASIGSQELFKELSNSDKGSYFAQAIADLQTAQKLALKNNNQEVYKQSVEMQNKLQDLSIKVKSTTPLTISTSGITYKNTSSTKTTVTSKDNATITYSSSESDKPIIKTGELSGICSEYIKVPSGKSLNVRGIITGKIKVEKDATLTNNGTISGKIENNGTVITYGTVSGKISNYGRLEIYGVVSGKIYTNNNVYVAPEANMLGKMEKF